MRSVLTLVFILCFSSVTGRASEEGVKENRPVKSHQPVEEEGHASRDTSRDIRCPYCHDEMSKFAFIETETCKSCGAGYDLECWRALGPNCIACNQAKERFQKPIQLSVTEDAAQGGRRQSWFTRDLGIWPFTKVRETLMVFTLAGLGIGGALGFEKWVLSQDPPTAQQIVAESFRDEWAQAQIKAEKYPLQKAWLDHAVRELLRRSPEKLALPYRDSDFDHTKRVKTAYVVDSKPVEKQIRAEIQSGLASRLSPHTLRVLGAVANGFKFEIQDLEEADPYRPRPVPVIRFDGRLFVIKHPVRSRLGPEAFSDERSYTYHPIKSEVLALYLESVAQEIEKMAQDLEPIQK